MNKSMKILVGYHKPAYLIKNDIFEPIHLGRALASKSVTSGDMENADYKWMLDYMIGDDTGENISELNSYFNEMTALYWAWKNYDKLGNPDYIGFMHYRRHFLFDYTQDNWVKDFENINEEYITKYGIFNPYDVLNYDYLVNQPCDYYESVYNQYKNAPNHYIEDLEYVTNLIKQKYPHMADITNDYLSGNKMYFCNMFVMKKEIFFEYCEYMFNILFDIFNKGYYLDRTSLSGRMYFSERISGIYFNYLKTRNLKYKEVPISFIKNMDIKLEINPIEKDTPAIIFALSNQYVPIFSVCLQSIIENSSSTKFYDICILNENISTKNKKKLRKMCPSNFSIRFISIIPYINKLSKSLFSTYGYYSVSTYYRFFIQEIFKNYSKVLYLDADLIVRKDIAELYTTDLSDNYIAATKDLYMYLWKESTSEMQIYLSKKLGLKNPDTYFQAGVMLFNIEKMQKDDIYTKLIEKLAQIKNPMVLDQDILNTVCQEHIKYLEGRWNFDRNIERLKEENSPLLKKLTNSINQILNDIKENYYIVHYAGPDKPWNKPEIDYANCWWASARKSPFYEEIIKNMCTNGFVNINTLDDIINYKRNILYYWKYKFLKIFLKGKTKERYITKRFLYKEKIRNAKNYIK